MTADGRYDLLLVRERIMAPLRDSNKRDCRWEDPHRGQHLSLLPKQFHQELNTVHRHGTKLIFLE